MTLARTERLSALIAVLAFLATFVAGLFAGAAGVRVLETRSAPPRGRLVTVHAGMPAPLAGLGLTARQQQAIRAVFERYQPRSDSLLRALLPGLRTVTESVDRDVRAVLTPAQRAQLDALRHTEPMLLFKRVDPVDSSVRVDTVRH